MIENRKSIAMVFLIFISLLVSCSPIRDQTQPIVEDKILLSQGISIGQTFVAVYDGLKGIQIYLEAADQEDGEIILEVRANPDAEMLLVSSTLHLDEITDPGFYEFRFLPINTTSREYYYARLYLLGNGSVYIGTGSPFTYMNGALHVNEQPQDSQMAFNLLYDSGWSLLGVLDEILYWIKYLLASALLFVIPGWGFLSILWSGWHNVPAIDKLLLSSGVSVALYPILFLFMNLLGLHPGALLAWLPVIGGILVIVWRNRKFYVSKNFPSQFRWGRSVEFPTVVFLIVTSLIIFTRLWAMQLLEVPMWGDSYHHTMISQLLVDNRGLFDSWKPYADLNSFTYHFGFHASAAVFHWITGYQLSDSVLWVGQIFNVLAVLVLFPIAARLGGNRWAGVVAVFVSGILIQLPMVYANWGRFTQLTGQVILPVMMYFIWDVIQEKTINWKSLVISAVLIAGMSLSHYRILFFGLFFMLVLLLFHLRRNSVKSLLIKFTWIGIGSLLLFLPWFIRVYGSTILQIFRNQITTTPGALSQSAMELNAIGNLTNYLPIWAWVMVGAAAVIGLMIRPKSSLMIFIWVLFLLIGTNPNWIGLPGTGILSNFALFIAVYIPTGLIVGVTVGAIIEKTLYQSKIPRLAASFGILTLVLALSWFGISRRLRDINPDIYALVARPDVSASNWIRENLPKQSKFLVNSFLAYNGTLAVGSDGGLWVPLLAERATTLPPITYGFEKSLTEDNIQTTNQLIDMVLKLGPTNPEVIEKLREQNITHVYIGQRRGRVNYSGSGTLNPEELEADPHFQSVYHQDLVWIFSIFP
jgi:hypothetical protein